MDNQPIIERLLSVRIRLHISYYLVVVLITGILATQYPVNYPLPERILLGLLGSLLFLASLLIVQLLNNLAAILVRIPVKNSRLFVFGGVAPVPEDSTSPRREIAAAIVTFLINLIMATVFNWLFLSQSSANSILIVLILQWLAFFWYMLALVHIVPAFPLVGGRILAAILWKTRGSYLGCIRLTATIGRFTGIGAILGGIALIALANQIENGLILIFFGWVLQAGATFGIRRTTLLAALQNTTVNKIMREFPSISPGLNLEELISQQVLATGQDYFVVADQGKMLGIMTLQNIKRVPRDHWSSTLVGSIMTPWKETRKISSEQPAAHVLEEIEQYSGVYLPISENDEMIGTVARDDLYHLAKVREQMKD